MSKINKNNSRL